MEQETWKSLKGIVECGDNYSVSTLGNVRNDKTGRVLKNNINPSGYCFVVLSFKGKTKTHTVHKLVALSYITNQENKPQVNHKDGDKTNNSVRNLEWSTAQENIEHAFNNGLSNNYLMKLDVKKVTAIKTKLAEGLSCNEVSALFEVPYSTIHGISSGRAWARVHVDGFTPGSNKANAKGDRVHTAKLTEADVLEIRKLYDTGSYSQRGLAKMFNVGKSIINNIVLRKSWKHI